MKYYKIYRIKNCQITKSNLFALVLPVMILLNCPVMAQQNSFTVSQANPMKDFSVLSKHESHPFFADIDGDGDLDCFSGEYANHQASTIYFYRNDGTTKIPVFKAITGPGNPLNQIESNTLSIPYLIDIDNDGDYDCFIGEGTTGAVIYYKNIGSRTAPDFQKQSAAFNSLSLVKFTTSGVANLAFTDIDNDGDYDCLVADEAGFINYFKNSGTAENPVFEHVTDAENPFAFLSAADKSVYNISFEDWNKDGLVDLFINSTYYKNIGTKQRPQFSLNNEDKPLFQHVSKYQFTYTPLRWIDLNNDGITEVFQGNSNGDFIYQTLPLIPHADTIASRLFVNLFPNPSKDEFTISNLPIAFSILRVADAQGKLLITQNINNGTLKFGKTFKPGTYFVEISQKNKVIYSKKVIKE